mmetsp:Transcript_19161/g.27275  ORF Transcript_19161/g.27275 Transcript_19161/m.27275 type:complete len:206 (-) Transcript_19161:422-1039(-)|eukprot:CAMPEP_0172433714 /NCGR_PEP_ID=MMETSP1064-20121228/69342_1 /TAXON_ID=202472 /ORGANISM="Aulacoseira subarctica , Strain CCAP 1002/5" /LENGTH=205 /DNA_ID=CAMNT_0013181791 /DNA_START=99 /DNA_END=716 /DNA_ORIENTATION=+
MFLPSNTAKKKREEKERREAYARIEEYVLKCLPPSLRDCDGLEISVQEVQCGDPSCSPIDTAITIIFASGEGGMFGIPMEAKDVTEEDLLAYVPTEEVLEAWSRGESVPWPPEDDDSDGQEMAEFPPLRFTIGKRVLCRVGPDEWALGTIVLNWYREPQWPENSWAPYKIQLDDGRSIFAPGDMDQVIRAAPSDDESSPAVVDSE